MLHQEKLNMGKAAKETYMSSDNIQNHYSLIKHGPVLYKGNDKRTNQHPLRCTL